MLNRFYLIGPVGGAILRGVADAVSKRTPLSNLQTEVALGVTLPLMRRFVKFTKRGTFLFGCLHCVIAVYPYAIRYYA